MRLCNNRAQVSGVLTHSCVILVTGLSQRCGAGMMTQINFEDAPCVIAACSVR